jgi:hypothetical protein
MTTTRPSPEYFVRSLRATVREAIWLGSCRHEQGSKPNILLFASRRGGSTFAMEMIGANRGIRPLNQPLETLSRNLTYAQALEIPRFRQGQITSLDTADAEQLASLMEKIFSGRVVINAPTRFWRSDVARVSNRLVLKLTDCKPVIDWFDDLPTSQILYLTRHPIPQAMSCLRNGWTLTVDAHLGDQEFVEANLSDAALAMAHDTMSEDRPLRHFIMNWALENVAPIRHLEDRPTWTHVRYEDCVLAPQDTLQMLADRLSLDDVERMHAVLRRPSQSSRRSTGSVRDAISSGQAAATVHGWKSDVANDDQAWCDRLLETFGIDPRLLLQQH